MASTAPWTCPTCRTSTVTPHCPTCGERMLTADDLKVTGLLAHVFHSLSSIDGRLLRTFRSLLLRPGELTASWLEGRRKPFIAPFQFFLIANVLFFAVQSLTNVAVFSTPLQSHLNVQDWSEFAQSMVAARLNELHMTLDAWQPLFDQQVEVNAKSMVILMTLPFALVFVPMFARSGRPFVTHLIFSLHFYAFVQLFLSLLLAVAFLIALLGGAGIETPWLDRGLFGVLLTATAVHLYIATRRVYHAGGALRVMKVLGLTIAVAGSFVGYRFLVFVITLYSTP